MAENIELLFRTPQRWDASEWREHAACAGEDSRIFFPVGHGPDAAAAVARAKQVCRSCPARETCLEFAVTTNQEYGVWGGLDEDERRAVRRRWRRANRAS